MIIPIKKFLFLGLNEDRDLFFKAAQGAGIIQFIDRKPTLEPFSDEVDSYIQSIKILRAYKQKASKNAALTIPSHPFAEDIIATHHKKNDLKDKLITLDQEISRASLYGDFDVHDLEFLKEKGNLHATFFYTKAGLLPQEYLNDGIFFVGDADGLSYFFALTELPFSHPEAIPFEINLDASTLHRMRKDITNSIAEIDKALIQASQYVDELHLILLSKLDDHALNHSQNKVEIVEDSLFAVEGWVAENTVARLNEICNSKRVHYEQIATNPDDIIPTHLENTGLAKIGEDLVHVYDTPSISDQDPSLWVLAAFALFFAIIIGDGGYGIIYLLIGGLLHFKIRSKKPAMKRLTQLIAILGLSCILWGLFTHSFFGIEVGLNNSLRQFSVLHWMSEKKIDYFIQHQDSTWMDWVEKNPAFNNVSSAAELLNKSSQIGNENLVLQFFDSLNKSILFELSLFIGVIHLIISFMRYIRRNWSGIGWILFLIGAYSYFAASLELATIPNYIFGIPQAFGSQYAHYMMYGGMILAVAIAIIRHKLLGLVEITLVIQIFADVLSYLRLYALGLAGAILSATINEIALTLPLVLAIVVIIISHSVNIILGVMGGVIHGLRLNFLESYHYSFEGGGKIFQPLRRISKE